jgi:DNA end-binding protein Ku
MARPIWKGNISFGLVTIPVSLYSAEKSSGQLRFRQLDRRDLSLVKEKRVSDESGREVPWEEVVKGYEYGNGEYVVLEPEDFERANVKATQTIDIVQAVPREAIPVQYFQTPYYLVPGKAGRKAYQVLRETLRRTDRVAVAMIVLRARQHLAAVMPEGDALMLDLLRFAYELRAIEDLDVGEEAFTGAEVSDKELVLAEQLVGALDGPWEPEQYRDKYRDDLLAMIQEKAKTGSVEPVEAAEPEPAAQVVDMMELLRKSVEARAGEKGGQRRRRATKSA